VTGKLWVIGLGPGNAGQLTPEASDALRAADIVFGYGPYLDRVPERAGQQRRGSDNRQEIDRAAQALAAAAQGANVAVVSGGDPGVFAMAAAVCEALESGPVAWRELDLTILPGVTGMLAVAARTRFLRNVPVGQLEAMAPGRTPLAGGCRRRFRHRRVQSHFARQAVAAGQGV